MKYAPTATNHNNTLNVHVRQSLFLRTGDIPRTLLSDVTQTLTIVNPKYERAEKAGRWTGDIDRLLEYYETRKNGNGEKYLVLPRGFLPSRREKR